MKDDVSALLSSQASSKTSNLIKSQSNILMNSPQASFNAFKNELLNTKMNLVMPTKCSTNDIVGGLGSLTSGSATSLTTNMDSIDNMPLMKLSSNTVLSGSKAATSYLNDFEQQIKLLEEQAKQLKSENNNANEDFFIISSMQNNNIGLSYDQFKSNPNEISGCNSIADSNSNRNQPFNNNNMSYDFNELNNFNRACLNNNNNNSGSLKKNSLMPIFNTNSLTNLNRCDTNSLTDIKNEEIYLKQVKWAKYFLFWRLKISSFKFDCLLIFKEKNLTCNSKKQRI